EDIGNMPSPNVKTDGLLPFVINRLKTSEDEIKRNNHQIRFAISRGPLNIASFLMGTTEFMMSLAMNPEEAQQLLDKITSFICEWIAYQKECFPSIDGIFVLDDIIGFIGEDEFRQFVIPSFKKIFNSIDAKAKFLHNDAQGLITARFIKEMDINMFNFSFEHTMGEIRELSGPEIILVGNIPPRDILAAGTPHQVKEAVRKAMGEIKDHSNIIWSCGGGIPPDVKSENISAFVDAVKNNSK
ncbi:MAG: uroporphyrinogen decarboxylase family protein, partial [Bacteroidales bacterium]